MFRRRKSLHIGADFGNDSDSSENAADARSGLENGRFLLIGSGGRRFVVYRTPYKKDYKEKMRSGKPFSLRFVPERSERNGYNYEKNKKNQLFYMLRISLHYDDIWIPRVKEIEISFR